MKGKLIVKLVSVAIALAMLAPLASVSLADSIGEISERKVFTVSFNMDGNIKCVETEDGTPVKKPEKAPEKEGYIFSHWFVKGDIYREPYDFNLPVTGNLNLEPLFLLQAPIVDSADADNMVDLNEKEPSLQGSHEISDDLLPPANYPQADPEPDEPNLAGPVPDVLESQDADAVDPVMDAPARDADDDEENIDEIIDNEVISDENINGDEAISDENINDNEAISDENMNDDEEIENTVEPEEPVLPDRSIRIWTDAPETVEEGHLITLHSELIGYEDCIVLLRWQYSTDGGNTWQDAVDGTDYTYTYAASKELSQCLWHLCVTVLQEPIL